GLPAMAMGQAQHLQTDAPPSRASPLPHLIFVAHKVLFTTVHCQPRQCSVVQPDCSLLNIMIHPSPYTSSACGFGTKLALTTDQIHSNNKKVVSCH
ncbi:MAG: hypothetical protein ACRC07_20235, partial [Pseudomonas paracarnis]